MPALDHAPPCLRHMQERNILGGHPLDVLGSMQQRTLPPPYTGLNLPCARLPVSDRSWPARCAQTSHSSQAAAPPAAVSYRSVSKCAQFSNVPHAQCRDFDEINGMLLTISLVFSHCRDDGFCGHPLQGLNLGAPERYEFLFLLHLTLSDYGSDNQQRCKKWQAASPPADCRGHHVCWKDIEDKLPADLITSA